MKKIVITTIVAFTLSLFGGAYAQFAGAVIDYTPGTLLNADWSTGNPSLYNNPNAVLGQPNGIVDYPGWPCVYSPFNPPCLTTDLTGIGVGGQLTLQLQNYVTVAPGAFEIGIWSNVGLVDTEYGQGVTGNPVSPFGPPACAVVSVSADGISWVTLNNGNPITFGLPGNYYLNAGPEDPAAPASPQLADFGKPFTGTLSDFNNETYSQVLSTLNGSAGGTWLDLSNTGLSEVGYIRFSDVPSGELDLSTVSINSSLAGAPVPEPGSAGLLLLCAGGMAALMRRRRV